MPGTSLFQREDELDTFAKYGVMDEYDPNKRWHGGSIGFKIRGLRSGAIGTHNALSEAYCGMLAACADSSISGKTTAVIGSSGCATGGINIVVISSQNASTGVNNSLAGGVSGVKWQLFSTPGDLRLERHAHIKHSTHIDQNLEVCGATVLRGHVDMDSNLTVRNGAIDCTGVTVRPPLPPAASFETPAAFPPAGADYAEVFDALSRKSDYPDGLLMTLDKPTGKLKPCQGEDDVVLGVTSASAGFVLGARQGGTGMPTCTKTTVVLGMLGQLRVRISNKNGAISPGDYLMPGKGGIGLLAEADIDGVRKRFETNIMVMRLLEKEGQFSYAHCFISGFYNHAFKK